MRQYLLSVDPYGGVTAGGTAVRYSLSLECHGAPKGFTASGHSKAQVSTRKVSVYVCQMRSQAALEEHPYVS